MWRYLEEVRLREYLPGALAAQQSEGGRQEAQRADEEVEAYQHQDELHHDLDMGRA